MVSFAEFLVGSDWTCFSGRANNSFSHSSAVGVWPGRLKGTCSSWTGHTLYSFDDRGNRKGGRRGGETEAGGERQTD